MVVRIAGRNEYGLCVVAVVCLLLHAEDEVEVGVEVAVCDGDAVEVDVVVELVDDVVVLVAPADETQEQKLFAC